MLKVWQDNEKIELQKIIGVKAWNSKDGWFTWTQEDVDDAIAMYEKILTDIKEGAKVSKTVDGQDDIVLFSDPGEISSAISYSVDITLDNGEVTFFGPCDTKEADEILNRYN